MKCLVTGGVGFIGSHLVQRLQVLGHDVTVLDKDAYPPSLREDVALFWRWDVKPDWVFHLAALTDVIPSIEKPVSYLQSNVMGTARLLEFAVATGVKRFIYASSTSIYGIPQEYPTPETAPAAPQYPYALSKWLGEEAVMHWGQVYKLPVVALRPTTVYGPGMVHHRQGYGSAIKVFLAQKANGAPYTVVGDGSQSRDFVHIDDVVEAFIRAAESDISGEAFNVGYGQPRTINELLALLGESHGRVYVPKRPGEPDMTWADIRKIKRALGWEPKVNLEQGVLTLLANLDEWRSQKVWTPEDIEYATKSWFRFLGKESVKP